VDWFLKKIAPFALGVFGNVNVKLVVHVPIVALRVTSNSINVVLPLVLERAEFVVMALFPHTGEGVKAAQAVRTGSRQAAEVLKAQPVTVAPEASMTFVTVGEPLKARTVPVDFNGAALSPSPICHSVPQPIAPDWAVKVKPESLREPETLSVES